MPEVGNALTLDIAPVLSSFDKVVQASEAMTQSINQGRATLNQSAAEAARQATAYSDALARQQGEVRAASEAVRSAREELKRLTEQQDALTAAQKKVSEGTAEYQRLTRELGRNQQAIVQVKQAIQESQQATRDEKTAVDAVRDARRQEVNQIREAKAAQQDLTAQVRAEAAAQRAADKEAAAAAKEKAAADKQAAASQGSGGLGNIGSTIGQLAGVASVVAVVGKAISFAKDQIVAAKDATAEYERVESVLAGAYDGNHERATRELNQIEQFGTKLPFSIKQVEDSYLKLDEVGLKPTQESLRQIADLAAFKGKDFSTVSDALIAGAQGQTKALRQLNITAKEAGDQIEFTFKNQKTLVDNNQQAIAKYVLSLGDLPGIAGQAAAQLNTLNGAAAASDNAFSVLYEVIGERAKSAFGGFNNLLAKSALALAEYFKSTDRLASDRAAPGIDSYAKATTARFERLAAAAKAGGKDVGEALAQAAADQLKFIEPNLKKAEEAVARYYKTSQEASASGGGEVDAIDPQELARLQGQVLLYRGKKQAIEEAAKAAAVADGGELDRLGRIEELRKKIAAETLERDKTLNTDPGNKRREKLNMDLEADRKLLAELEGKQEKTKKAREYSYESQLRALLQERETLTSLAAKASEKIAISETDRAKQVFDEALRQVDVVKGKLVQREEDLRKAALKAGGQHAVATLGDKADGVVDGAQQQQLAALRVAALDSYYAELSKAERERQQRLFELQADSVGKEVAEVNRKYDALLSAQHLGQSRQADAFDVATGLEVEKLRQRSQEEIAIEEARQRDLLALRQRQQQQAIDQGANLAAERVSASVGEVYGEGTGISVIEAKRAEKQALLEIEQKHAQDTLNNAALLNGKEGELARANAAATVARVGNELRAIDQEKAKHKATDSIYKLVFGEDDSDELRAQFEQTAQQVVGAVNQILAAQLQAEQAKVQAHQDNIASLQSQLAAEIQLSREGSASNIKGIQDQINAEKQAKRAALAESRQIAKQQQTINDLQAVSAIGLAVANIIAGWSTVPLAGSILGIVAAAATVASFVATKASAASAAQTQGSFFVGGYTGGDSVHEERGPVHGKEFVFDNQKTSQYRLSLFEPLHAGRPQDIDWQHPSLAPLLPTASMPDLALPATMAAEKAAHYHFHQSTSLEPMRAELAGMRADIAHLKGTNERMANRPERVPLGEGRYMELGDNGSSKLVSVG